MKENEMIDAAFAFAVKAHTGQRDKSGAAYLLHPVRVMGRVQGAAAQAVALMHDVLEDSDATAEDLRAAGFPEEVVAGVEAMTRAPDESYGDFVDRAAADPIARRVKLADIEDNLDLRRLAGLGAADMARLQRYLAARKVLMAD
ncbi:phosphohydrolase [Meridianimarinicoccus roseus]|nr:phosphohydrolase [Meridianimarinicoccus roseus]